MYPNTIMGVGLARGEQGLYNKAKIIEIGPLLVQLWVFLINVYEYGCGTSLWRM